MRNFNKIAKIQNDYNLCIHKVPSLVSEYNIYKSIFQSELKFFKIWSLDINTPLTAFVFSIVHTLSRGSKKFP